MTSLERVFATSSSLQPQTQTRCFFSYTYLALQVRQNSQFYYTATKIAKWTNGNNSSILHAHAYACKLRHVQNKCIAQAVPSTAVSYDWHIRQANAVLKATMSFDSTSGFVFPSQRRPSSFVRVTRLKFLSNPRSRASFHLIAC
jgi:hypothetical protein